MLLVGKTLSDLSKLSFLADCLYFLLNGTGLGMGCGGGCT